MSEPKWTKGPWEVEHRPSRDASECGCVVVDSEGNELFDTFNRGYKVSLVEQNYEGTKWYDTAGFRDLTRAAKAPELYERLQAVYDAYQFSERTGHTGRFLILLNGLPHLLAQARGEALPPDVPRSSSPTPEEPDEGSQGGQ